tara:strand:+ start:2213 stop:3814 length:1602 start_codon:yes stop_codon:yes gene_type:complete
LIKTIKVNKQINYKITIGLSLLLVFKFYFYTRGYFFSNFVAINILYQCIILLILNSIIIFLYFKVLNFFKQNYFIYNLLLTILVALLTVYTIKTFFYFINIISFKEFIFKYILINFSISYSIKTILIFIVPYLIFFLVFIFVKKKENYLRFLSILGFIFLFNFIYTFSLNIYDQYSKSVIDKFEPYTLSKKNFDKDRKAIWIFFDAFDPYYAFKKEIVELKNFDDYIKKSINFSNAMSPSDGTLVSMLANLIGTDAKDITINKNSIDIVTLDKKYINFNKDNTIFGRLENDGISSQIYSSVLDYCSLLKIQNCQAKKYEEENFKNKWYYGIALTYPIVSQFNLLVSLLNNVNNNSKEILDKRNFSFSELDLKKFNDQLTGLSDIDGIGHVSFDIFENFLKSENSMLFVHLYLPHTPADYIKQKLSLTTNNINEDYYLNLIYTDFVLSRIIKEIKKNRQKDLLLVLNSDHWYNSGSEFDKIQRPVLQIFNIIDDETGMNVQEKVFTHQTQEIIHRYLIKEINTKLDILKYYKEN